jgi:hypothetical protein
MRYANSGCRLGSIDRPSKITFSGALYGCPLRPLLLRAGSGLNRPVDFGFAAFGHLRDFYFRGRIEDRDGLSFAMALHEFTINEILVTIQIASSCDYLSSSETLDRATPA